MSKTKHIYYIIFLFTLSLTIFQCNCKNSEELESQVTEPPTAPGGLNANAVSYRRISLTWADNSSNETGFRIERAPDNAGSSGTYTLIASVPANSTSYSNGDLTAETRYHYRICAYNSTGNSSYSNEANAVTPEQTVPDTQIIADHTVVDLYDDIPQFYIDIVKTWLVDAAGESHSAAYRDGMNLLESNDPEFLVQTFTSSFPAASGSLRIGSHSSVGEEDFWTNTTAINNIKNIIANQHTAGNPINVIFQAWCWDFTRATGAAAGGSNAVDPDYHCHWYGSSEGGPQGDHIWGLDAADYSITGNSLSLQSYLDVVDDYRNYCETHSYVCVPVFTTGPVDGNNGGSETGYQREVKHNYIRSHVMQNESRILFDYADILCYNDAGEVAEYTWDDNGTDRVYKGIHPDNGGADTGHIGNAGALRLAKAMWWMLARMAGWDGQ